MCVLRITIHSVLAIAMLLWMSFFAWENLNVTSSKLSTADEIEEQYALWTEKVEQASQEIKNGYLIAVLTEEKTAYQNFSRTVFSFKKILKGIVEVSLYAMIMLLCYSVIVQVAADQNASAILNCIVGITIMSGYAFYRDGFVASLTNLVTCLSLFFVAVVLIGLYTRSRFASIVLIFACVTEVYAQYVETGYIGYTLLLLALSLDAAIAIFMPRLTSQCWGPRTAASN